MLTSKKITGLLLILATVTAYPRPLAAQDSATSRYDPDKQFEEILKKKSSLKVGLGAFAATMPYKGENTKVYAFPFVFWRYKRFYCNGISAGWIAYVDKTFKLDIYTFPRILGFQTKDNAYFDGMKSRQYSLDAGARLSFKPKNFKGLFVSFAAATDILGRSNGQELSLHIGKDIKVGWWYLIPSAGAVWQSSRLADYYYGVTEDEARPNRPAYTARSGTSLAGALSFMFPLSKTTFLFNSSSIRFLDRSARNSPLVSKDYLISEILGISWTI